MLLLFYDHSAAVDCGELTDSTEGNVQFARTTFGSVAVYECDENYVLSGGNTRLTKCGLGPHQLVNVMIDTYINF